MNVADSGIAAAHFENSGMAKAVSESEADVVVLNTCTVRSGVENRALAYIGRLAALKEKSRA